MDLEEFLNQLAEHKSHILIGICVLIIGVNFASGGANQLRRKFAQETQDTAAREAQSRAETIYREQGCTAQAISNRTRTSNFRPGDQAIDPLSVTQQNPGGTAINSGYLCSSDGSLFRVENGQVSELIGTSPAIRNELVKKDFALEAQKMQRRSQSIYNGGF